MDDLTALIAAFTTAVKALDTTISRVELFSAVSCVISFITLVVVLWHFRIEKR